MSVNWVITGSGNGNSPMRHQPIISMFFVNWTLRNKAQWKSNLNKKISRIASENDEGAKCWPFCLGLNMFKHTKEKTVVLPTFAVFAFAEEVFLSFKILNQGWSPGGLFREELFKLCIWQIQKEAEVHHDIAAELGRVRVAEAVHEAQSLAHLWAHRHAHPHWKHRQESGHEEKYRISRYTIELESLVNINQFQIDGLMQERRNSIANALELRLSCVNPSRYPPPIYKSPSFLQAMLSTPSTICSLFAPGPHMHPSLKTFSSLTCLQADTIP